jgi:hypothetical protein
MLSRPEGHPPPTWLAELCNELVIYIFKIASATSRESCLALSLVATWTREIALPYLFETLLLKSHSKAKLFTNYVLNHRNLATFIRNLWLPPAYTEHQPPSKFDKYDIMGLLRACDHLENLAAEGLHLRYANPDAFVFPHLQVKGLRLFVYENISHQSFLPYPLSYNLSTRSHMYSLVTHLYVNDYFFTDRHGISSYIATFPRLTHFAVATFRRAFIPRLESFRQTLMSPTLVALVIVTSRDPMMGDSVRRLYRGLCEQKTERLRVYVAFGTRPMTSLKEESMWLDMVEGRSCDVWERAIKDTEDWGEAFG